MNVIAKRAPPEQRVVAIGSQLVIESCDIPVSRGWNRTAETVPDKIMLVAESHVCRFRKTIEVAQHHLIRTDVQRVHCSQIRRSERRVSRGRRKTRTGNCSPRALRRVGALINHDPLP